MKITKKSPEAFFLQGNKKVALLLIHGFTGSPAEMSLLGLYLNQQGYTVYAPKLAGHGTTPEEMATTNKEDWWKSVVDAYDYLKKMGYEDIVAIGLSMGGVLSLKLSVERKLKAVIPMAAAIFVRDKRIALARWLKYIRAFHTKKKKEDSIDEYLVSYDKTPIICVESLYQLIKEVRGKVEKVNIPILVLQGKRDETVIAESASYIYNHVQSTEKEIKWYERTGHIMPLDKERDKVFDDINEFLKRINNNEKNET